MNEIYSVLQESQDPCENKTDFEVLVQKDLN